MIAAVALVLLLSAASISEDVECNRPTYLTKIEEECFEEHSGIVERIQQKATNMFAEAKKKLGIVTPPEANPKAKKCEYYHCMLNRVPVLNMNGLPDFGLLQSSSERYLGKFTNAEGQVKCFDLVTGLLSGSGNAEGSMGDVTAEINGDSHQIDIKSDILETVNPGDTPKLLLLKANAVCEMCAELVKCLYEVPKNECPLFIYP